MLYDRDTIEKAEGCATRRSTSPQPTRARRRCRGPDRLRPQLVRHLTGEAPMEPAPVALELQRLRFDFKDAGGGKAKRHLKRGRRRAYILRACWLRQEYVSKRSPPILPDMTRQGSWRSRRFIWSFGLSPMEHLFVGLPRRFNRLRRLRRRRWDLYAPWRVSRSRIAGALLLDELSKSLARR